MAISVAQQYYSDLNSLTLSDPLCMLQTSDHFRQIEQMEFATATLLDQAIDRNNYNSGSNSHNGVGNNGGDLQGLVDQTIGFNDSSNSPESWTTDYQKYMHVASMDMHEQLQQPKKRRMEWEPIDINGGMPHIEAEHKMPSSMNGVKERERNRKQPNGARLGWTDDIDFDLNADLTNNPYLNNDSIFSLSSALTALKQETPSPSSGDQLKKDAKNIQTGISKEIAVATNNDQTQLNHSNELIKNSGNASNANDENLNDVINSNSNSNSSSSNDLSPKHTANDTNISDSKIDNIAGQNDEKTSDEPKFQYVLAAATSIATKSNEETITYLNQGQSYEIKLKKLGDLSAYRGKLLRSVIKICFHERRLQYMEREQMQLWQASRPGERIVEIDVPLSYGLCHVSQPHSPNALNVVEVHWDPMKEVGVYIKVNCISTEFTPKKHGGEKGVPFRIQVETFVETNERNVGESLKTIHAAACQIKVFKLKGADRKHKQDREKIQKRPPSEKEKYQPSYECTILNDLPSESLNYSPEPIRPTGSPLMSNSPIHATKFDGIYTTGNSNGVPTPIAINSVSSTNSNIKIMDQNIVSPPTPQLVELEEYVSGNSSAISKETSPIALAHWLTANRLGQHTSTFAHFTGADVLRMSKDDLIQICGLADGIRMYNTLHSKALAPRLTIYVSFDGSSYHAIYLYANTTKELTQKLMKLPGFADFLASMSPSNENGWNLESKFSGSGSNLYDAVKLSVYIHGPSGIHVYITDEVLGNIKDESLFAIEIQNSKVLMKAVYKHETN